MHMAAAPPDIVELNRRAVRASLAVVNQITPADLRRPTPCEAWTLDDLLAHMTAQHEGFAAAAAGRGAALAAWKPAISANPAADYAAAAARVLDAFAADGVTEREFVLPELSAGTFPGAKAIGFHLVDYVVHAWDVARSVGAEVDLDRATLDAALVIAQAVPDGPVRQRPGSVFGPAVPAPPDASVLDRIVALLGRSPHWAAHALPR